MVTFHSYVSLPEGIYLFSSESATINSAQVLLFSSSCASFNLRKASPRRLGDAGGKIRSEKREKSWGYIYIILYYIVLYHIIISLSLLSLYICHYYYIVIIITQPLITIKPQSLTTITGWWYTYPSEKHEFVSWDDEIPNIWKVIKAMFQTIIQYMS